MKFILVEDNEDDAEFTLKFFAKRNLEDDVLCLRTGDEAWNLVRTLSDDDLPNLIIADLSLPGMNGIDFIKKVKYDDALKTIPVVVLTGSEADQDIIETYKLRVDAYLIKPIDSFKFKRILLIGGIPVDF